MELVDTKGAAELLKQSPGTLQNWRIAGFGPPFIRSGRSIRYDVSDLKSWAIARRVSSTSESFRA